MKHFKLFQKLQGKVKNLYFFEGIRFTQFTPDEIEKLIQDVSEEKKVISILHPLNCDLRKLDFILVDIRAYEKGLEQVFPEIKTVEDLPIKKNSIKKRSIIYDRTTNAYVSLKLLLPKNSPVQDTPKKIEISAEEAEKNAQKLIEQKEKEHQEKLKKNTRVKKKEKKNCQKNSPLTIQLFDSEKIKSSSPVCIDDTMSPKTVSSKQYSVTSSPLPDFFGEEKEGLIGELETPTSDYSNQEFGKLTSNIDEEDDEPFEDIEEKIFDDLEHSILDPMINELLNQSEDKLPKNNYYCQLGSQEHQRRMKEWNLAQFLPEIYCLPQDYLISLFSQSRHKSRW